MVQHRLIGLMKFWMISIAQELQDIGLSKDKGDAWEMIEVGK